ncbi:hypothetical protein SAMN04488095_1803 [Jannaschia pohangensis]|uniref:Uncharacterized protein n=1 Tax=Jannaschia pohangensis TaxID=390807 RepID=A0A1I3MDD5_9RHOB|nr:hypothetical protein SAMN04488095_1803 [Jannaschia pohangensis]
MILDDLLTRLLMPVARLAIGRGLGVRDLSDPLKRAFLAVAEQQEGARQTDSRLALVTGLQRRDVVRLRDARPAERLPSAPARLLTDWPEGAATLPRIGPAPSFEALARATSQDIHPRTLLDLLVAAGSVAAEGDDVRLVRRAYVPGGGSPEQLEYLAANLHDHGTAAVSNVLSGAEFFDRAAHYTGFHADQVEDLRALFERRQMEVLREIAQAASAMEGGGPLRARFGGYAYWEDTE